MKGTLKDVDKLTAKDLDRYPVWEYVNDDSRSELLVRPVSPHPVRTLSGRVVGTTVELASGQQMRAQLSNVDEKDAYPNIHFLTLSVEKDGKWFTLARYHDIDVRRNGPKALAAFLGLPLSAVFPIRYDLTPVCVGNPDALRGTIVAKPVERLSEDQLTKLAVRQAGQR